MPPGGGGGEGDPNFGPERSSIEIKTLIRKLHPDQSNHKDRLRRINKFRNYVLGDSVRGTLRRLYPGVLPDSY
jgi:hypothetical protein